MTFNFFEDNGLPREVHRVSTDTTVTAADFIRGVHYITADLSGGDVTTTYDVGIPDGYIIYAGVYVESDPNKHLLFSSDPASVPFESNRGVIDPDFGSHIDVEGVAAFKFDGGVIRQFDGSAADMIVDTGLSPTQVSVNLHSQIPDPSAVISGSVYYVSNDPNPLLNGFHLATGQTGSPATGWEMQ